ncbi:hypothetical protein FB451DRAFT_1436882, partial [Mycena latifolia]
MGQRHQVFIVACVAAHNTTTPRYRCVGAYQCRCYGRYMKFSLRVCTLAPLLNVCFKTSSYGDETVPYSHKAKKTIVTFGTDNDDGITVIDITEPTNPSYCFLSIWGLGGRTIWSGAYYVRAYYPVPSEKQVNSTKKENKGVKEMEEDVQNKIHSLRDERIMTLDVLAETYPKGYKVTAPSSAVAEDPSPASNSVPSLVDLSL